MEQAIEKAKIFMEALPYIKEYKGRKVLIKFGGKAMADPKIEQSIAQDLAMMRYVGLHPVVVHGGGRQISKHMKKQGLEPRFVEGLRVTGEAAIRIAKHVLFDLINKEITENINSQGDLAVGICGDDSGLIVAEKMEHRSGDLGFVGTVKEINTSVVDEIIAKEKIPVITCLGRGKDGLTYNINADSVASALASALGCEKIIFLTNVDGIYKDFTDAGSLISALAYDECKHLVDEKIVSAGMLPKVLSCMKALGQGVHRAHILNGNVEHALLLEIFTDEGVGTMITNS